MSATTAITHSDQDLQLHSPTDPMPDHVETIAVPENSVLTVNASWAPTQTLQPEVGESTWRPPRAQVRPLITSRVTGLDKWEGKVLQVEGEIFTAELYPIERDGMPITVDFDLELLGSDAATISPGDVFYLSVRTIKAFGMRPTRTESLRLRRLGRITTEEVQKAYAKADALMERLEQLFD